MADGAMCSRCGAATGAGQRFCGACGAPLERACPSCGEANPGSHRFCGACGATLDAAAEPGALPGEGERRRATVLFADLSGFTRLSERLDPEEVTTVVDRCMGLMAEIVARFGGRVARIIGDELMALFGAPLAHEDDPERAVRAALELQACAGEHTEEFGGMGLRVGMNTGEMMFGPVGPEREFTVMGDAVNVAKRLQTAAPLGGVLVGEDTYRATRHAVRYETVPRVEAKGKSEPVPAWRAVEAVAAPTRRPVSAAPIVGRESELDLLRRIWSRVESEGRPHLVTVLGPPGIGKTRAAGEFTAALQALGARVVRGRSLPYGESTGYGAFAQQLQELAAILETDPAPVALRKLRDTIARTLPAEQAGEVARTLPALAGLEAEEAPERGALFLAARRFVEAVGRERPTVLVFEDLHWADATLLDLVEFLAARARDAPVLLLTLARPELLQRRANWGGGLASYAALPLEPLSAETSGTLVRNLLPWTASADVVGRVVDTSGGNPLFIEELAATLSEQTAGAIRELPTSVTGIIAARLDTLPPRERRVLLNASVVGKVFWRGALERMGGIERLDEALDGLEVKDFVRREAASRMAGDVQYLFKHMLIREVAYQTLPKAARRDRHKAVATFIEGAAGDRIAESASLLAHHWREAGETDRAIEYFLMAAEHAGRAWARGEAISLYTDALELIPEADLARRRGVLLRRAMERVATGDVEAAAADLDPILEGLEGRDRVDGLIARARAAFWLFRADEGAAFARRAVEGAEAIGADDLLAPALAILSQNLSIEGDRLQEAIAIGERPLELWRPGTYEDFRAAHINALGLFAYWIGDYGKAVDYCERGYDLSVELQAMEGMVTGGANYGLALAAVGRYEEAVTLLEKVIAQGRERGVTGRWLARAMNMLGGILRDLFDLGEARRNNEEGIELASAAGFAVAQAQGGLDLAFADLLSGEVGAADRRVPALRELAEKAKGFHQWLVAGRLAELVAEIALVKGDGETAADAAADALAEAGRTGRVKYQVASRLVLGSALLGLGKPEDAAAEFGRALEGAESLRHPPSIWRAAAALARGLAATGDDGGAEAAHRRAAGTVEDFAVSLSDARRERLFAHPSIREVLALGR